MFRVSHRCNTTHSNKGTHKSNRSRRVPSSTEPSTRRNAVRVHNNADSAFYQAKVTQKRVREADALAAAHRSLESLLAELATKSNVVSVQIHCSPDALVCLLAFVDDSRGFLIKYGEDLLVAALKESKHFLQRREFGKIRLQALQAMRKIANALHPMTLVTALVSMLPWLGEGIPLGGGLMDLMRRLEQQQNNTCKVIESSLSILAAAAKNIGKLGLCDMATVVSRIFSCLWHAASENMPMAEDFLTKNPSFLAHACEPFDALAERCILHYESSAMHFTHEYSRNRALTDMASKAADALNIMFRSLYVLLKDSKNSELVLSAQIPLVKLALVSTAFRRSLRFAQESSEAFLGCIPRQRAFQEIFGQKWPRFLKRYLRVEDVSSDLLGSYGLVTTQIALAAGCKADQRRTICMNSLYVLAWPSLYYSDRRHRELIHRVAVMLLLVTPHTLRHSKKHSKYRSLVWLTSDLWRAVMDAVNWCQRPWVHRYGRLYST